jgi:4-amino-4-deoxy-L-arabinose transferase-like glycosyltransferase
MKIRKFIIRNLLFIILLAATFLRLWKLGSIPPHLTPDEASLGYNAYCLLKTGRDEYGKFLPIIFKSFGDYKPGLYIYLTVPFVAIFGLTEFAVRLPGVVAGVFAVWLIYKIVEILRLTPFAQNDKIGRKLEIGNWKLEILTAVLLAISPWHIHFSRGAWEVNVALTFTLAGTLFFLQALKEKKYLYYSAVFFALTLITYQGAKLSTAIVVLILTITYWKEVLRFERTVLVKSVLMGLVISLPIIASLFSDKTGRLAVFSVFSYPRPEEYLQTFLDQGQEKVGDLSYYLYHSEVHNFARGIMGRWFNHFSGRFLFFEGDWQNLRHTAPNHGVLLLSDLLFLTVGFVALIRLGWKKHTKLLWLWLILAPLPAVLSRDQVHAVRAFNLVIPLTIISSLGIKQIFDFIQKIRKPILHATCYILLVMSFLGAIIYYLDAYFIHVPIHDAKHWHYGYKQIVQKINPIQDKYENIKVQQSYSQPYIYFLFYGGGGKGYDPAKYQEQSKLKESSVGDVGLVEKLDNIDFVGFSWPYATGQSGTLVVGDYNAIPSYYSTKEYDLISEIKYPDNISTAFRILEVK